MRKLWSRMLDAAEAGVEALAAALRKFADETNEATRRRPETDYWRGYTDAMDDMRSYSDD